MRFGTFRSAYRVATRHFGSDVAYRRYYQAPRTVAAMMPYLCTRTNPVTLRLEDQAADGSSNVKQLFSTSMSGSALLSPASELSLGPAQLRQLSRLMARLCVNKVLVQSPWDIELSSPVASQSDLRRPSGSSRLGMNINA